MTGALCKPAGAATAFPGAVGHGANASGGRSGTIYRVTSLADSGAGSFRDAVSQPNRIIIFDVGGYVTLTSEVALSRNLTIAGQSAPGGGIAIRGAEISTGSATNLIIRHVRLRPGSSADEGAHCINIRGTNVILDQVSLEFGPWNNVGGVNADQLSILRSFIADPIGQQFGAHMERLGGNVTWYQNIFANGHNRQPLSKINTVFINNVVYNYEAAYTCGNTSGDFSHDIIGNYFITGPATDTAGNDFYQIGSNQSIYESGNLRDSNRDGVLNGANTLVGEGTSLGSPWSPLTPGIPAVNAPTAFRRTISLVGAWPRDQVDNLILNEVRSVGIAGPNALPGSQSVTGLGNNGFGTITGGATPLDTDQDGMPDYWEASTGASPNNNDAMTIGADGYARIEGYLNWLAEPHALTATNTPVNGDLWTYTAGFTNAAPVYFVDNATNGTVTLTNGHVARFTPTAGFIGLGSFRFAVISSDGLNFTNTVVVLMSGLPAPANLLWRGDGAANLWVTGTASNWFNGDDVVAFTSGDNVTFDDTGSNSPAINLTGLISAGLISVMAEQDYTFAGSGALVGPSALLKTGPGKLTLNNLNTFSGGTTITEGVVQLGNGTSVNGSLSGNVTNHSELVFANASAVSSSANISGSGTLTKIGAGVVTLSGNQSYTNLTTINAGTLEFSGTPLGGNITNNSALGFRPATSLTYSGVISGPGSVNFNASGQTLTLNGANTYTGGTTNSNGTLRLANQLAAGSGPVSFLAGAVHVGNGAVITNTFIVPSSTVDSMMDCVSGTGTWAGNVVLTGGGAQFRPSGINGTLRLTGNGALGGRNLIVPRGTVEFAGDAVFSASGSATAFGRNSTANSVTVRVRDNASVSLGAFSLGGGQGSGGTLTLTIQDNASFSTGLNNFDLHNSTAAAAVSVLNLNGGTLTVGGFAKSRTGAAQFTTNNLNGGTLQASRNNVSFLPVLNGLTTYVRAGGARIEDGGFNLTIAAPLIHDPALGAATDGGLTKLGSGSVGLSGSNTFIGPTMILNGWLSLLPSGSVRGSIHVGPAGTFSVGNANPSGTFTLGNGRTISGSGTLIGGFVIGAGAMLAPGSNSNGTLTFNNASPRWFALAAGSTNFFEVSHSPLTNDLVKVLGALTNGGTVIVSNVGAMPLAAGDSFKLFDASTHFGAFGAVVLPPLNAGLAWDTNQLNTAGVLSVVSTAPPTQPVIVDLSMSGDQLVLRGSNGLANGEYLVLGSTNIALPLSNWTRLATNQFDASGGFSLTNAIDPATPQQFIRLRLF